jgi:hypothetical protein
VLEITFPKTTKEEQAKKITVAWAQQAEQTEFVTK